MFISLAESNIPTINFCLVNSLSLHFRIFLPNPTFPGNKLTNSSLSPQTNLWNSWYSLSTEMQRYWVYGRVNFHHQGMMKNDSNETFQYVWLLSLHFTDSSKVVPVNVCTEYLFVIAVHLLFHKIISPQKSHWSCQNISKERGIAIIIVENWLG